MRKRDVKSGYWCRTVWDDLGASDGLIVKVDVSDVTVYFPAGKSTVRVEFYQITEIGNKLSDMGDCNTGLTGMKVLQEK